jgi:uncharacterized membrane protein
MHEDETSAQPDRPGEVEGLDGTGNDMSRLLSLSDGIFAFALTFLVVTLVLPTAIGSGSHGGLNHYLQTLEPGLLAYFLSFFIIAGWWRAHHRLFSPIVRYDPVLVRLNNFFLLLISITPFLVGILFEWGPSFGPEANSSPVDSFLPGSLEVREAVIIYAVAQVIAGLTLLAIWHHATHGRRLVPPTLPADWVRVTERDQVGVVLVFAVSIPVAIASPLLSELVWILMIFGFGRRIVFKHRPSMPRSGSSPTRPKLPPGS